MQKSNERMVESMTEAERAQHAEEIMEQLGPNIKGLLQRVREARAKPQDAKNSNGDSEGKLNHSALIFYVLLIMLLCLILFTFLLFNIRAETPKKTKDTSVSTEDDKDLVIGSPATSENHEDSPPVELSQPTPNQLFNLKGMNSHFQRIRKLKFYFRSYFPTPVYFNISNIEKLFTWESCSA